MNVFIKGKPTIVFGDVEEFARDVEAFKVKEHIRLESIVDYVNRKFKQQCSTTEEALVHLRHGLIGFFCNYLGKAEDFLLELDEEDALDLVSNLIDTTDVGDEGSFVANTVLVGVGNKAYALSLNVETQEQLSQVELLMAAKQAEWPERYIKRNIPILAINGKVDLFPFGVAAILSREPGAFFNYNVLNNPYYSVAKLAEKAPATPFTCYGQREADSVQVATVVQLRPKS